jgi:hypothetical protein
VYSTSFVNRVSRRTMIISRDTSSDSQSATCVLPPSSSAITPPRQNACPKMLAARSTWRASSSRPSMRACAIATTVSGSRSPFPSATERISSSR